MLYADDILLFVSQPDRSMPALLDQMESFSKVSGYRINWTKSEGLPLTSYCPKTLFHPGTFSGLLKELLIWVLSPPNLRSLVRVNFEPCLKRLRVDIDRWSPLFLYLWVKTNVIKMISVPKFHYLLQALPLEIP